MSKTFGDMERHILSLFHIGEKFSYDDKEYMVMKSGKPTCKKGEPKTDIYIEAKDLHNNIKEFKISFKKKNADFLENKTNSERAAQLLGNNWRDIISSATYKLKNAFFSRMLIYKEKLGKTERGAITLGWKFELLNVLSGELSGDIQLTKNQVIDVYAGSNLSGDKRDAAVSGVTVKNSGVANYILFEDDAISSAQQAIDALLTIEDYVDQNPNVYFACKALNYRTFKQKYDGNRPLAVYVDWHVTDGQLDYDLCFDTPLQQGGDDVYNKLRKSLDLLHAVTTDDLDSSNVKDSRKIHE